MSTDASSLTLRDVLERAGQALAARDGLSPAAGVQSAYALPLSELAALDLLGEEQLTIVLAPKPAAEAAQQLGVGSGPEVASTSPGPGEAALVKDWKAGDEAAYKAAASPTAETAQAAPAADAAPAPEPTVEDAKPKE